MFKDIKKISSQKRTYFGVGCNAVIFDDDQKVLLLKRSSCLAYRPNGWDFPGGKMEAKESPHEAIRREILEETGLSVRECIPIDFEIIKKPECENSVLSIKFIAGAISQKINLSPEHQSYKWISINEIPEDLDFTLKELILKSYNNHLHQIWPLQPEEKDAV